MLLFQKDRDAYTWGWETSCALGEASQQASPAQHGHLLRILPRLLWKTAAHPCLQCSTALKSKTLVRHEKLFRRLIGTSNIWWVVLKWCSKWGVASELGQKGIFLKDFVERQAVQLPKMKAEQGHGALARAGSLVELWSPKKFWTHWFLERNRVLCIGGFAPPRVFVLKAYALLSVIFCCSPC